MCNDAPLLRARTRRGLGQPFRPRKRRGLDQRGSVAVEFALILPVLVFMLYTLVEVGRGMWTHNVLQLAVEEASRFAAANPTATASQIQAVAQNMSTVLNGAPVTWSVSNNPGATPRIRYVTVQATLDHQLLMPVMRDANGTPPPSLLRMTASARMPVIQ